MMTSCTDFLVQVIKGDMPENKSLAEWRDMIRLARASDVLPRIAKILLLNEHVDKVPEITKVALESSIRHMALFHNQVRFEAADIADSIRKCSDSKIIFLKGSAYVMSEHVVGVGRVFSDVDVLVEKTALPRIEKHLMILNWQSLSEDDYDLHYYREWAHEIPPLRHMLRHSVLDLHHNIIPPVSGKAPVIEVFTQSLKQIGEQMYVLDSPAMVLHSIVHLFYQEEFHHGFRDLSDLYLFFEHESDNALFWQQLSDLAGQTQFKAEVYLAYRYVNKIFGFESVHFNNTVCSKVKVSASKQIILDWVFCRVLMPNHGLAKISFIGVAEFIAMLRGHLLKMPPKILVKHTAHKAAESVRYFFTGDKKRANQE